MVKRKSKELEPPLWVLDGFVGVLAFMLYNFTLYLVKIFDIGAFLMQMEQTMGYFGVNAFLDFGLSKSGILTGTVVMFIIAFIIGVLISGIVRKKNKNIPV